MSLTRKQKNQILAEKDRLSAEKISSKLKLPQKEVEEFLNSQKSKEEKVKTTPKWFYTIPFLIPVVFFILLEIALRLFNYGTDITQWIKANEDKYLLNPDVARRYFYSTKSVPESNQNSFDIVKKKNAFRVFVLGESSAAGYPFTPNGDFGRYIRKRLELEFPTSKIEVVNLGITAINSYTIRDLFPGVLEQKPDLILIYTGHNEYYGALGVGSMESLGNSPYIVNTALYLNKFKTFQLIRNTLKAITGMFSGSGSETASGTLMSRMAKDKLIRYKSDIYYAGLKQYESNISDILEMAKDANVPVILGTVTFNIKDQPPFVPTASQGFPNASEVFNEATAFLKDRNFSKADSLFRLAKDLDGLKFRAPEALNEITRKLGNKFNDPVVEVDKEFNRISPDGIVGNNLMVDHLHPTLAGYWFLGKIFYNKMKEMKYIPKSTGNYFPDEVADSIAISNFYFSRLDSIIGKYRIIVLKNDWPFTEKRNGDFILKQLNVQTALDSIALNLIDNNIAWEKAHRQAATWYFTNKDYDHYLYEIKVLTDHYPFITEYYDNAAEILLQVKQYDFAYEIFNRRYAYAPSALSAKWLGIIDLSKGKTGTAIKYLKESTGYDNNDPQVFFNLAGAYSMNKEYPKALEAVERCLTLDPNFPEAQGLKQQLRDLVH